MNGFLVLRVSVSAKTVLVQLQMGYLISRLGLAGRHDRTSSCERSSVNCAELEHNNII